MAWALLAAALVDSLLCIIRLEFNYKSLFVSKAYIGAQAGRWKPVYGDFVRIWARDAGGIPRGGVAVRAGVGLIAGGSPGGGGAEASRGGPGRDHRDDDRRRLAFFVGLLLASAPARAYRQARMFQLGGTTWGSAASRASSASCALNPLCCCA